MAGETPPDHDALHPDLRVVAEHSRNLLRDDHPPSIRRGSYTSAKDLIAAIEAYIDGWNERCQPFAWTKTADQILTKAQRKKTSNTRH